MTLSQRSKQKHKLEFEAIGTHWIIEVSSTNLMPETEIFACVESFDKTYSRFRPDSLVTKMSKSAGIFLLPADASPMLALYKDLYQKTNGAFTPLIGNLLEQAGYDSSYSLKPKELTPPLSWNAALMWQPPNLKVKTPVLLDFGAAGKGYLIDLVGEVLKDNEINSFSIDAGGDILLKNFDTVIGLENPLNTTQAIGVVEMKDGSIAASAGNRRNWGQFHHIINPQTLKSTNSVQAVWVIAKTAMVADALSTCLFLVDPETLSEFNFEFLILYPDFSVRRSKAFPGKLYEAN